MPVKGLSDCFVMKNKTLVICALDSNTQPSTRHAKVLIRTPSRRPSIAMEKSKTVKYKGLITSLQSHH